MGGQREGRVSRVEREREERGAESEKSRVDNARGGPNLSQFPPPHQRFLNDPVVMNHHC
jgi:hypothetical protein